MTKLAKITAAERDTVGIKRGEKKKRERENERGNGD